MDKKPEDFENCNHHLSLHAVKLAVEMSQLFGNAAFSLDEAGYDSQADQRAVTELRQQRFLVDASRDKISLVARNKAVLGLPAQYRGHVEV